MAAGLLVDGCGGAVLELPVGMPGGMLLNHQHRDIGGGRTAQLLHAVCAGCCRFSDREVPWPA